MCIEVINQYVFSGLVWYLLLISHLYSTFQTNQNATHSTLQVRKHGLNMALETNAHQ